MAYCGKPSTACHACREKRGKCDRKKPGCGQCARKRRPCPGYPDPSAVVIRDQTQATARKARAKNAEKQSQPRQNDRSPSSPSGRHAPSVNKELCYSTTALASTDLSKLSLCTTLTPAPEDLATTYFLTAYAPASPTSYLGELATSLTINGLSTSAILAPALVTLSRKLVQPALLCLARKYYSNAILETNRALADRQLAVKDATLASVLLLALFEALTFRGRRSPTSWTMHIEGAAELLRLRGPRQFDTTLGRKMFIDMTSDIFASCAQRRVAVNPALTDLLEQLREVAGEDDPEVGIASVTAGMANVTALLVSDPAKLDSVTIVQRASKLETQLSRLLDQVAEFRPYVVVNPLDAPETAYNGLAHVYQSPQACRHWNILRMMRLFVNKWIFRAAAAAESELGDDADPMEVAKWSRILEVSAGTAERMAIEILATVPYFQGLPPSSNIRLTSGRWLIWPLSGVATNSVAPVSARIYARNTLYMLGQEDGITQAAEAWKMVEESTDIEDWLHVVHLS